MRRPERTFFINYSCIPATVSLDASATLPGRALTELEDGKRHVGSGRGTATPYRRTYGLITFAQSHLTPGAPGRQRESSARAAGFQSRCIGS